MSVIVLLIVAGGAVAAGFLGAFVWAVRSGQFDDTCTPAIRILFEERELPLRPVGLRPEGGSHRTSEDSRGLLVQAEENRREIEGEMSGESGRSCNG